MNQDERRLMIVSIAGVATAIAYIIASLGGFV
jgi:hypothetical protein